MGAENVRWLTLFHFFCFWYDSIDVLLNGSYVLYDSIDDRHRESVGEIRYSMADFFQQYISARFPDKLGRMEFSYSVSFSICLQHST